MSNFNNYSQRDFERYIQNRTVNDPRYNNLPINNNFQESSSEDDSFDENENENGNSSNMLNVNNTPSVITENNTVIIQSQDRDIYDKSQSRFSFKVKFSPSTNSFTKKFPIYENSEYFLQTEYQKKLGIQGHIRNIEMIERKENLGIKGFSTSTRQCKSQPGLMYYDSTKPRGDLIGYNILYENGNDNSANIQKNFTNIESIEIKKLILPLKTFIFPWNKQLYGNIIDQIPYINIKIPELKHNFSSTSNEIRESFAVLVPQFSGSSSNLNLNTHSYITFVPINNDIHIYTPPMNNLNILTIQVYFPPSFLYSPPAIGTFRENGTINNVKHQINDIIQEDIYQEVQDVKQLIIFNLNIDNKIKNNINVNQPVSFLSENMSENLQSDILCFAIITEKFFNKDLFFPGSVIKLHNYIAELSENFGKISNLEEKENNPSSFYHYIPNMFIEGTEESEKIFDKEEARELGKNSLINNIIKILGQISNYFNTNSGIPIIEVGHIKQKNLNKPLESEKLKNCYEYINSYINNKYLGLDRENIPYCNILGTNKSSKPFKCGCIPEDQQLYGLCDQITANDLGPQKNDVFSYLNEGFYKYDENLFENYRNILFNLNYLYRNINNDKEYTKNIYLLENNLKSLELSINNFFYDIKEIINNESNKIFEKVIISEIETALEIFHSTFIEKLIDTDYTEIKIIINTNMINSENLFTKLGLNINEKTINSEIIVLLWYKILRKIFIFIDLLNLYFSTENLDPVKKIEITNIFMHFVTKIVEYNSKDNSNLNKNIYSDPYIPKLDNNVDYPMLQNPNCNGKLPGNRNNICRPPSKYKKGGNKDGLCNVIIVPFPNILNSFNGEFLPIIFNNINLEDILKIKNLGYGQDINFFESSIELIAFKVIKEVLFNGGPASFPKKTITPGGIEKKCKVISLTMQNTFVFEIKTQKRNINKII